jgi:hypothetical protein
MKIRVPFLAIVASLLLTTVAAAPTALPASAPAVQSAATMAALPDPPKPVSGSLLPCPVTQPNTDRSPDNGVTQFEGGYGNDDLWTNLWMLGEGRVLFEPGGSGFVLQDGSLGIKWAWYRHVPGYLTIDGRRLDAPAPPLRYEIPANYGLTGFQVLALIFPTPGCWEVTGRVGDASLTFVKLVERLGDGPSWRPDETS